MDSSYPLVDDGNVLLYTLTYDLVPDPHRIAVESDLSVAQTIVFSKISTNLSAIKITSNVKYNISLGKAFTDTLALAQNISGFLLKAGLTTPRQISDQLSSEAQADYDSLTTNATVVFLRGSNWVELRPPDWSNKNNYQAVRIQRETKGGDLHVFQESRWPTTETLTLPFSHLTQSDANAFMDFIKLTLGKTIAYTDHLGRIWLGVITNPDTEFRQVSKTNFAVSIDFQGELQ